MTYKSLQVLRTAKSLRNVKGHPVAKGTRVVVVNVKDGVVTARQENKLRITGAPTDFIKTHRGRPKTSAAAPVKVKKVAEKVK